MSAAEIVVDLARRGVRLEAHGDRLRYFPRSAVTPDLLDRLIAHKGELLAMLRGDPVAPAIDRTNATAVWQAALDRLEGDPLFPPDEMRALRAADARWANDPVAGDVGEAIDPPDPCPRCGTLELWQTLAGNWRCLRCDPPTAGPRQRSLASRLAPQRTGATRDAPDDLGVAPATPRDPVCRCGSTTWRDVPIHGGQSVRRDCARCKRFIDFPIWYGRVLDN